MYLDTCILVKLISREPDSEAWHGLVLGHPIVTSELAVAEVRSALMAKERLGRIPTRVRHESWRLFQEKLRDQEIGLLSLDRRVVERAAGILEQCHPEVPLRTLDALHVATAELHGGEEMASSDQRVRDACDVLGLPLRKLPEPR